MCQPDIALSPVLTASAVLDDPSSRLRVATTRSASRQPSCLTDDTLYIEANFGTMRRMADYHFAQAASWPEIHAVHARFFHDHNHRKHFARQDRPADEQSLATVLRFVHGAWCAPADLDRLFRVRAHRRVDAGGYIRFRDWRLYGERGLAGAEAAVWLLGNDLTVEHATDTLARYRVAYAPDDRHIRAVAAPRLFEPRYPSPQPFLEMLAAAEWHPAPRLARYAPRRRRPSGADQVPLFELGDERSADEA